MSKHDKPVQEPVAMLWQHRETGRTRVLMPNERTATDVAAAWDVVGPLYLAPPHRPAEPVQEPVAWVECDGDLVWNNREAAIGRNLYTSPPPQQTEPSQDTPPQHEYEVTANDDGTFSVGLPDGEELRIIPPHRPAEPVQEPVAWRYKKEGGGWFVSDNEPQYVEQWNDIEEIQPLYTAPPQRKPEPNSDYERGFVDGMSEQARRSVDKAVNAMTKCKPLAEEEIARLVTNDMVKFARAIERAHGIT